MMATSEEDKGERDVGWDSRSIYNVLFLSKVKISGDFLGDPVVETSRFHSRGHGFDHWLGN